MQQKQLCWKTDLLLFSIYLCFFLFLTSCNPDEDSGIPDFKDDISQHSLGEISDKLVARIYFDASVSMKGFVVPNSTKYKSILSPLESVITSGWKNGRTEFFSFGENVQDIDRDSYLSVGSVDFYVEWRTYIQKIFEYEQQLDVDTSSNDTNNSPEGNHIVVIVTDLFQDRRDVNLLVRQLKEKYINNGLEVGLLGLRSEFDGTVYNLGTSPILYSSKTDDPETFRPFYLLVIGRHADIARYFDSLIAKGFVDAQTIIFSQHLVNPLLSFENATIDKLENLNRVSITKKPNPRAKEYRIHDRNKPSQISAKLKFQLLPHVLQFDSETFNDLMTVKYPPNGIPDVSQQAKNCLTVTSTLLKNQDSNELSVEFTLDSQSLPRRRIYLYEVTLHPKFDTYQPPTWCSEWDMGDEINGAKTLNLVNFVSGLEQVTTLLHNLEIAKFHFYIEKR